ncbi:hypothetical protein GLA29479_1871 [Lysobacter antibioticus]|nr:hypothetical protein GLA29479_1871 [Lysobacter antibioticus]
MSAVGHAGLSRRTVGDDSAVGPLSPPCSLALPHPDQNA